MEFLSKSFFCYLNGFCTNNIILGSPANSESHLQLLPNKQLNSLLTSYLDVL